MASIVGRVDIAIALVPSLSSIVVVLPTRRPSPLSCPCSIHCCHTPLSITVESSVRHPLPLPLRSRCPLPSITVEQVSCGPLPSSCRRTVHHRRATSSIATVAIAVTIAPSIAVAPSIAITVAAINATSRSRLPLPLRCRCIVQRVASSPRHPLPLPLCCRRAPFPLSLLVDCCLFTPPPLPLRLPLPSPVSALHHRCIVAGEAMVVAIVIIIVSRPHTSPPLPSVAAFRPC